MKKHGGLAIGGYGYSVSHSEDMVRYLAKSGSTGSLSSKLVF